MARAVGIASCHAYDAKELSCLPSISYGKFQQVLIDPPAKLDFHRWCERLQLNLVWLRMASCENRTIESDGCRRNE